MNNYILIVEDDNDINHMLKDLLEQNHYAVKQAFSGTEALMHIEMEKPAALILDLMLPGMTGEEILVKVKEKNPEIAVIISSAKEDVQTKVSLLRAGADDYITKPFDTEELLARLEVALRKNGVSLTEELSDLSKNPSGEGCGKTLQYKDIVMEPDNFKVTISEQEISLTKREYLILELLMENPGKVFTKSNIYESVWNEEFLGEENAVNVHISNIRQKLAKVNEEETYIQTVWGIGFKMK